jgi:hypothetical protein
VDGEEERDNWEEMEEEGEEEVEKVLLFLFFCEEDNFLSILMNKKKIEGQIGGK